MKGNAESDVVGLEHARLASLVDADIALATSLHAPDYELITPGGGALTREAYLGSIADGSIQYNRFEAVSPVRVRAGAEAAIVRYRCAIDINWPGGHEQGEYWHTDYWERRGGRWQAVWSHATQILAGDA